MKNENFLNDCKRYKFKSALLYLLSPRFGEVHEMKGSMGLLSTHSLKYWEHNIDLNYHYQTWENSFFKCTSTGDKRHCSQDIQIDVKSHVEIIENTGY